MMKATEILPTGKLGRQMFASRVSVFNENMEHWVEGHHDPKHYWFDLETQQVSERPAINLPPDQAFVGTDWTIPAAPAGTEVWLDGQHLGTTETETDDEIVVIFPLPGLWRVELRPPFPWREAGCSVEVSHAD